MDTTARIPVRSYLLFGAFYFFYFVLIGVYIIYLPQMLKNYGYSATQIGIIYAAAPMMRFITPFLFRRYITLDDKIFKIALISMVLSTVISAVSVGSFGIYLFASIVLGGAMGAVLPYVDTVALQVVSKEKYGKVRLWGSIGFILIALWLGQMLHSLDQIFYYLIAASILNMIAGYYLLDLDPHKKETISKDEERSFSLAKYWAFWVSAFLMQVSFGGFYNFFTIYESAHGIPQDTISYLWSFGVIIEIVMLYFQGSFLQNNLLSIIKLTTFSAILRWALLWLWPDSLIVSYFSQSLHAFSFALYYTATISYVYRLYTQKKLAQQFYLGITFGLGGSAGALIAGWIYSRSPEQLFGWQALFAMLAFTMVFVHQYRKEAIDETL